jgi:amidophosphoribosyltransferase
MPTRKELIANKKSITQMEKYLKVDSLRYLSLKGMLGIRALPETSFCHSCFSGKYPIKPPTINGKNRLREKIRQMR